MPARKGRTEIQNIWPDSKKPQEWPPIGGPYRDASQTNHNFSFRAWNKEGKYKSRTKRPPVYNFYRKGGVMLVKGRKYIEPHAAPDSIFNNNY